MTGDLVGFLEPPAMPAVQYLDPAQYRRTPWKNGGGVSIEIARAGSASWEAMGVAWHYGRTSIVANGPFSDLTGYDRLQVVVEGSGLVLVTPEGEIDLRQSFRPQRYDGGTPVVTRLETGSVDVVNLIADRRKFRIDLRAATPGEQLACAPGIQIVHAPAEAAALELDGSPCALSPDQAVRIGSDTPTTSLILAVRLSTSHCSG